MRESERSALFQVRQWLGAHKRQCDAGIVALSQVHLNWSEGYMHELHCLPPV